MKNIQKIASQIEKEALSRQSLQGARLTLLSLAKGMSQSNPIFNELKKVIKMLLDLELKK
jgi:hypothetical protein